MKTLKKTLCLVLVLALSVSMFAIAASAASYDDFADAADVAASKYAEAADVVVGLGIINGVSGNKVDLDGTLDRAMAAKILGYLLLGEKTAEGLAVSDTEFSDVSADNWASKYIAYAANKEILTGSNGMFRPGDPVEGYSLGKMILNALGYGIHLEDRVSDEGKYVSVLVNDYTGTYWATKVSADGNRIGLFAGLEGVNLNGPITRGQAMQMVFNALKIDVNGDIPTPPALGGIDYNDEDLAYALAKNDDPSTKDAYGRVGYYWGDANATDSTKAITDIYTDTADYVYKVTGDTITEGKIIEAYNKANGTEYSTASTDEYKAGTVVEFKLNADKTYDVITTYAYKLDEVASIATTAETTGTHKGAYEITMKSGEKPYTDDLKISVKKGDKVIVPYADSKYVWADAIMANPTTAKISEFMAAGDGKAAYIVVNGSKLYKDDSYTTDITDGVADTVVIAANFTQAYDFYLSPVGTLLGAVKNDGATEKYTVEYASVLSYQARAYGADSTDLLGSTTAGKTAAAAVKVVTSAGEVKTLNIAVEDKSSNSTPDYEYTGTDAINFFYTVSAADATDTMNVETIGKADVADGKYIVISYYTRADGSIVITGVPVNTTPESANDKVNGDTVTTAKGTAKLTTPDGKFGTSDTVINIVTKTGNAYSATRITGYKNFVADEYTNCVVIYAKDSTGTNTDYVAEVYCFTETGSAPLAAANVAFAKTIGTETADGTKITFVIGGKEVDYYDSSDEVTVTKGDFGIITLNSDGKTIASFNKTLTDIQKASAKKVTYLDANYIQVETEGVIDYKGTVSVYDVTGESTAVALEAGVTVSVFQDDASTVIFITAKKAAD